MKGNARAACSSVLRAEGRQRALMRTAENDAKERSPNVFLRAPIVIAWQVEEPNDGGKTRVCYAFFNG